jgi:hypothetical protein
MHEYFRDFIYFVWWDIAGVQLPVRVRLPVLSLYTSTFLEANVFGLFHIQASRRLRTLISVE